MDNMKIDVTAEGDAGILHALSIIWSSAAPGGKATHYLAGTTANDPTETLILFWSQEGNAIPLPFPLGINQAYTFIKGWLDSVDRGKQPDHDGDNGKGWRIFTDDWGHVRDHQYGIVGVQPAWAMYGK